MRFEHLVIDLLVAAKRLEERLAEIGMIQNRTESDVKNLAGVEIVEERSEFDVGQAPSVSRSVDLGGDVVAGAVNRVAFARESGYFAEELRRDLRDGSQGFEVTRARGLEMNQFTRKARGDRIYAELVGTGMEAELIRPEGLRDGHVPGERLLELAQIADVINALLEIADVPRSQAHPFHAEAPQFVGDVNVFGQGRHRLRLVHTHLQLERFSVHYGFEMAMHSDSVRHDAAILRGRAEQIARVHLEAELAQINRVEEPRLSVRPARLKIGPRRRLDLGFQ